MGTEEVIKFLHKHPKKEYTTTEMAKIIGLSTMPIKRIMSKLLKDIFESVHYRELTLDEKKERYGVIVNSRIRVYWIEN